MSNESGKLGLAKQLLKEFWLPAVVASAWGLVSYHLSRSDVPPWISVVKDVSTCFFLISWATSQYFRVKKQTKTESDLAGILLQLKDVLRNIEEASAHATALSTGGDSYCYVELSNLSSTTNRGLFSVNHVGAYTLYDVVVRVCDTDELTRIANTKDSISLTDATKEVELGTVYVGGMSALRYWNLEDGPSPRRYNCHFLARNGGWTQMMQVAKLENRWVTATKVYLPGGGTFEKAFDDYPRNPDGSVVWD